MKTFVSKLLGWTSAAQTPKGRRPEQRRVQLSVEDLERRDTPSAGVWMAGTSLHIQATDKGDQVEVRIDTRGTTSKWDDVVKVRWFHNDKIDDYSFKLYKPTLGAPLPLVRSINFQGGAAGDTVHNFTNLPSTMVGWGGNDKLFGGGGVDHIYGSQGNDEIHGGGNNDYLFGEEGSDQLFGDGGNDQLSAGWVEKGFVIDRLNGGADQDQLFGAVGGTNIMHGDGGADKLFGGDGAHNFMFGDKGADKLEGGFGLKAYNYMNGGKGEDTLRGGEYAYNILDASGVDHSIDNLYGSQQGSNTWYLGDPHGTVKDTFGDMSGDLYWPNQDPGTIPYES